MKDTIATIMFYDGGCGLCSREVKHYQKLDQFKRIIWTDISQHPMALKPYAIPIEAAYKQLHVVDTYGKIHIGIGAFLTLWEQLPYYRQLATFARRLHLTKLLDKAYQRFAQWRLHRRCKQQTCGI